MTCKVYIACALLLTIPGSQLSAADEKSITYYLPQSVIVAKFQVRKKVWHPAPYADVTPHFFPMAKEADLSKNEEDIPPNVFIRTSKSRYSLESPSISVSGVPDPNGLISVTSKGVLKDISTTLAFDDEGLLTTLKYTQKDRKWDFLLRILTTAAKVAVGAAGFPLPFSSLANTPAEDRNKLLAAGPSPGGAPSSLVKECPYFDEMTIAEREVLWSNELRPMLKMPYCLLPPEFRRPLRDLNAADGSGIAAFASYFAAELKDACKKFPCSATPNPFRPQPGSATPHRIPMFFEVWQLVDELEKIQTAHLASLSNYSNLPAMIPLL